jgi:glycosyltransferase involved in cell wall biosynthesis
VTSIVSDYTTSGTAAVDRSAKCRPPLRVCMLVYAFYESDTRVMQYATALAKRGDTIDVIALRRNERVPEREVLNGVTVHRIQARTIDEKGLLAYAGRILRFMWRSIWELRRLHRQHPYDIVHVHNVPDFLAFSALFPKLDGVPVILDIHDLLPELYASKFRIKHNSFLFRCLISVERCSAKFATHVIVANHLWRDRLVARSSTGHKCSVIRNRPDLEIFVAQARKARRPNERFVLIYPGTLNWHQGLDVAIRAFASVSARMPEAEFHIYGEGPAKPSLIELAKQVETGCRVIFHDFLPSHEIAKVMATSDLAIEPKRATSAFGNEALSTKILEFMTLGVPIIASKTRIHAYYYDDSVLRYYENDDFAELAEQMVELRSDRIVRENLVANALKYAHENSWDVRKHEYLELVDTLVNSTKRAVSLR